jgi:trafficking protein particle complex subunit 1
MLLTLYIYNKYGDCIYYTEWNRTRSCKSAEEEQRLMYGMLFSLRSFCQKASPARVLAFNTYQTSRYKLHYFESGTSARFVLLTR